MQKNLQAYFLENLLPISSRKFKILSKLKVTKLFKRNYTLLSSNTFQNLIIEQFLIT